MPENLQDLNLKHLLVAKLQCKEKNVQTEQHDNQTMSALHTGVRYKRNQSMPGSHPLNRETHSRMFFTMFTRPVCSSCGFHLKHSLFGERWLMKDFFTFPLDHFHETSQTPCYGAFFCSFIFFYIFKQNV